MNDYTQRDNAAVQYDTHVPATRQDGTVIPAQIIQGNGASIPPPAENPDEKPSKVKNGVFTATQGRMAGEKIQVHRVNPGLVQKVIQSVKLPKRPTYEVRTFSGRVEVHAMDELSASQTDGGVGQWLQYREDKAEAEAKRNEMLALVLFSRGTSYTLPNNGWEHEHETLGLEVPVDEGPKRAHYLATELETEDVNDLVKEILRLTGITEDKIKEAEATFRD